MLKLLALLGFFALTISDTGNQLILGYGCDEIICQFSIDVDEKMVNYVDTDAFMSRFAAIAATQRAIDSLEKNIGDLAKGFSNNFTVIYEHIKPNFDDFVEKMTNFTTFLDDTDKKSAKLNTDATQGAIDAECFYRNRTQPWVCNLKGFE
ncbi:unnamed protein product, partial [Mesorhabditis belari]|uniref:Uncharacterized protein n=1 Tax=Mesorhabditis belari TaxID=2138241 RepID=A0AAF3J7S4_9BILA